MVCDLRGMALRFNVLVDELGENRLSLFVVADGAFDDVVDVGCNTDVN